MINKLKQFYHSSLPRNLNGSLTKRVFVGGVWLTILNIVTRSLVFVRTIILARLLAPEDFGLFGIAVLGLSFAEQLTNFGIGAALVYKKDEIKTYLGTAWIFQITQGILVTLILVITAPIIAKTFDNPAAVEIIRGLSVVILLRAFTHIAVVYYEKEMDFSKYFQYQVVVPVVAVLVSLLSALLIRNAWALVLGMIAGAFAQLIVSWLLNPWFPKFTFVMSKVKELFGYGKWLFLSSMIVYAITEGDDIWVGVTLGTSALGIYQLSYQIANLASTELSRVFNKVLFPALSLLQGDNDKILRAFNRAVSFQAFFIFPIAIGTIVNAESLVLVLLGEQWVDAIVTIKILAFWGIVRAYGTMTSALMQAIGKPKFTTIFQIIIAILMIVFIPIVSKDSGINGVAMVVLMSGIVVMLIRIITISRIMHTHVRHVVMPMLLPTVTSLLAGGIVLIIQGIYQIQSQSIALVLHGGVFVSFYIGLTLVLLLVQKKVSGGYISR